MRRIISKQEAISMADFQKEGGSEKGVEGDGYWARVLACIPAETISIYLFIQKLLEQFIAGISFEVQYGIVIVITLGNIIYLKKRSVLPSQYFISTVAFWIWAYSFGEPFKHLFGQSYEPGYASLAMAIFSYLLPTYSAKFKWDK